MAASITAEEARHVASLPKEKGKIQLLSYLELDPFDEEINIRESIHLDYLYDTLMFATEKGFPRHQVCRVVSAAEELLTATRGKSMVEAVKFYQELSVGLIQTLGERNFQIYTEFVFSTFMTHYKLFQYVFSTEREQLIPKVTRTVVTPPSPVSLQESKLDYVWEYEQEYNSIEAKEKQKAEEWNREQHNVAEKTAESMAVVHENIQNIEGPLTKESVTAIIKDILGASTSASTAFLKTSVAQTKDDLHFKLERTVIPRPQALGPPPRFNPSTPVQVAEVIPPVPVAKPTKPEKQRPKSKESTKSNRSNKSNKS